MGFLERVSELAARMLTIDLQLKNVEEKTADSQNQMALFGQRLDNLAQRLDELGNRVTRLEAQRESDLAQLQAAASQVQSERSQMQADLEKFKAEVERAEMRLPKQLPPSNEKSN